MSDKPCISMMQWTRRLTGMPPYPHTPGGEGRTPHVMHSESTPQRHGATDPDAAARSFVVGIALHFKREVTVGFGAVAPDRVRT